MKIYQISAKTGPSIITNGFPISQRYRKDKQTGEKTFYPVGVSDLGDSSRSNYFFLSKGLQEQIAANKATTIDYIGFKDHNFLKDYLIAFGNRKDTDAFIVFRDYGFDNIKIVESAENEISDCPAQNRIMGIKNCDKEYCPTCHTKLARPESMEDVEELCSTYEDLDSKFQVPREYWPKHVMHIDEGKVRVFKESEDYLKTKFLDAVAVTIPNKTTLHVILEQGEDQILLKLHYNIGKDLYCEIIKLDDMKALTLEEYKNRMNIAKQFEGVLKSTEPNGTKIYRYPDKEKDKPEDNPFYALSQLKFD